MKVICYCRVATHDQMALQGQESELLQFADKHGYDVDQVIREYGSALAKPRPVLQKLIDESARPEIGGVLVNDLSRLHRNILLMHDLAAKLSSQNVRIVSKLQEDALLNQLLYDTEWREMMLSLAKDSDPATQ